MLKVSEDPTYANYFKMLRMGIPKHVVKNRFTLAGLDPSIAECVVGVTHSCGGSVCVALVRAGLSLWRTCCKCVPASFCLSNCCGSVVPHINNSMDPNDPSPDAAAVVVADNNDEDDDARSPSPEPQEEPQAAPEAEAAPEGEGATSEWCSSFRFVCGVPSCRMLIVLPRVHLCVWGG